MCSRGIGADYLVSGDILSQSQVFEFCKLRRSGIPPSHLKKKKKEARNLGKRDSLTFFFSTFGISLKMFIKYRIKESGI